VARARHLSYRRLQRARKLAGFTAPELARALDRSESWIWMIECGERVPPPELLANWCVACDCSLDYVFPEDDNEPVAS
jgi:transcriptional regulator with XRE-family HTH domain